MKKSPLKYLLFVLVPFAVLAVVLYFLHPLAPLLLLASLVIQLPLVWLIMRSSYNEGYYNRNEQYQARYREDGDAASWLESEEKEAASFGYKLLNASSRAGNILSRAELLRGLGREEEAARLCGGLQPDKLPEKLRLRYEALKQPPAPPDGAGPPPERGE